MHCRRSWSRDVLGRFFPPAFLNGEYKRHREMVLVDRERSLLPGSQAFVPRYREARALRARLTTATRRVIELRREAAALSAQCFVDKRRAEVLESNKYGSAMRTITSTSPALPATEYVAPCSTTSCRGYVSATSYECGTCSTTHCRKCGKIADHAACSPDDVASFKTVLRSTKACPKCAVRISKISGCDQMWCTNCQTAFSWRTGEIVVGVVHNPHYFEFMNRLARGDVVPDAGDGCVRDGRWPTAADLTIALRDRWGLEEPHDTTRKALTDMLQLLSHIAHDLLPTLQNRHAAEDNFDLRLRYLTNELTEDQWRQQLQRREKKRAKDVAVRDVYQMAADTGGDMYRSLINGQSTPVATKTALETLRAYTNEHLALIVSQYNMVVVMW